MDSGIRLNVFCNSNRANSCVLLLNHSTFDDLKEDIALKLNVPDVKILYSKHGACISQLEVFRDDDEIFASAGEPFGEIQLKNTKLDGVGSKWVTLNVGGRVFKTTLSTLTSREPESMLARMFSQSDDNHWKSSVDETGAYLIDRSGDYFAPVLDYLRHNELVLNDGLNPTGVLEEAKFYGITSIIPQLQAMVLLSVKPTDSTPISRRQMSLSLMGAAANSELRCQGLNFSNADLSRLDLRFVNFKYALLCGSNLTGANLSNVNFERADLTDATLDGANLMGVKMLCAQLEGSSMKNCNFEDPAGSRANMEGANMKHVTLEGSHMAGVNLRVANLKNSNLRNCDLRGAVLAGADLENCDLSGCDLQEANLRGANLEGAAFAMMVNALHQSQTLRQ